MQSQSPLFKLGLSISRNHAFSMEAKYTRNTSRCDHTTDNIIRYLSASPPFRMSKFENTDYHENLPLLDEFFDEKGDKLSHSFFLFQNTLPSHSYIIRKKWDGEKFLYRIHQSWRDEFTLGQWEGSDNWPDTEFTKQKIFKDEYRGKDITVLQVKQFLQEMVEISTTMKKDTSSEQSICTVTKYDADVNALQEYEELIDASKDNQRQFNLFKTAYFTEYTYGSFFKNPFSTMKSRLENGNITSLNQVKQYAQENKNSRTAIVLHKIEHRLY